MAVSNLAKLAKRNGGGAAKGSSIAKTGVSKKTAVVKEVTLTPDEERKLRIKETVDSLLDNVNLTNPNDLIEKENVESPSTPSTTTVQRENIEWFEEQIEELNNENLRLNNELADVKQAYDDLQNSMQNYANNGVIPQSMVGEGQIKETLINEYRLIKNGVIQMGVAQQPIQRIINTGEVLFTINTMQFIQRLEMLFPFLANVRE